MTTQTLTNQSTRTPRTGDFSFLSLARHIGATHRQRQHLGSLDDAALNDIGFSRSQADLEASRPKWDVPANWRR